MEDEILDRSAADQVLPVDAFQGLLIHTVIPDTVRIDDQYRPALADAETVGQRALDPVRVTQLVQLLLAIPLQHQALEPFSFGGRRAVSVTANEELASVVSHVGTIDLSHSFPPWQALSLSSRTADWVKLFWLKR